MSTIKLNEGQTLKVESLATTQKQIDELNSSINKVKKQKSKSFRWLYFFLFIVTLILVCRIPYVGSYLDSYVFEFIFGNVKYVLYLWLLLLFFFKFFNFSFNKFLYSRRFVIGVALLTLGGLLIISVVQYYLITKINENGFVKGMVEYIANFNTWAQQKGTNLYQPFICTIWEKQQYPGLDAGVIGTSITYAWLWVTIIVLALVALMLIVSGVLVFFNKTDTKGVTMIRKWLIKLLGGNLNNNAYDELAVQKGDCKINSIKEIEIKQEANKIERLTPPISFLTDTSIDTYYENRSNSEKYQKTIDKFIKDLNFQASFIKTNIMAQFCEICFEVDGQTAINEILRKQAELLQQLKISSYNITFKGNIIKFEIPNKKISKISLRNIFNTTGDISSNKAIAGMDLENNPLLLDFNKHNNALIVGMKGSGGAMVLTTTLISLAYTNRPFDLSFIMISVYGDKSLKQFNDLPHLTSPVITEIDDAIIKLHEVIEIINDRKNRFKDAGASTLEEFNKYQTSDALKLKSIVLVISSFDKIIKMSLQNTEILSTILEDGNKYGVNTILLSTNINTEVLTSTIYDNCNAKFILRLESEQESLKVFDSYRGIQLFGNGDGFFIDAKAQKKTRFQSCYMNIKELDEIINIIKKFYAIKETQI